MDGISAQPVIENINPSTIVHGLHRMVTVIGKSFYESEMVMCCFGCEKSLGTFVAKDKLLCDISSLLPGNFTLDIEFQNGIRCNYEKAVSIIPNTNVYLNPSSSSLLGGVIAKISSFVNFCQEVQEIYVLTLNGTTMFPIQSKIDNESFIERVFIFPPTESPGLYRIETAGKYCTGWFEYTNISRIHGISPTSTLTQGGYILTIYGKSFTKSCRTCFFGQLTTQMHVLEATTATCEVPPQEEGKRIFSTDCSKETFIFEYIVGPAVLSISPSVSIIGQNRSAVITIYGADFNTENLFCRTRQQDMRAMILTTSMLICELRNLAEGNSTIQLSLGAEMLISEVPHEFIFPSSMDFALTPSAVIAHSPLNLKFQNNRTFNSSTCHCKLSYGYILPCVHVTMTEGYCSIPGLPEGQHLIEIYFDNYDRPILHRIEASNMPVIASYEPTCGPSNEFISIYIYGENFSNEGMKCRFGERVEVSAKVLSQNLLYCFRPPGIFKEDESISVLTKIGISSNHKIFKTVEVPAITSIQPSAIYTGCKTRITVVGEKFRDVDTISCKASQNQMPKTIYMSSSAVICYLQKLRIQNVTIHATNDLFHWSKGIILQVLPSPRLLMVRPSFAPLAGQTRVKVSVRNLQAVENLNCKFNESLSPATIVSNSMVACIVPAAAQEQVVSLFLHMDGSDWNSSVPFGYSSSKPVFDLVPTIVSLSGGTKIYLKAKMELIAKSQCYCNFGNITSPTFFSESSAFCVTPKLDTEGIIQTIVSCDNGLPDHVAYLQTIPSIDVLFTSPTIANMNSGSNIMIAGQGFRQVDSLLCKIGESESIQASFLSTTSILCFSGIPIEPGISSIFVSQNGFDWSSSPNTIEFVPTKSYQVHPTIGSLGGGTPVFINSTDNEITARYCFFGRDPVQSLVISSTSILCVSPASVEGILSLSYSMSLELESKNVSLFEYAVVPVIHSISPSSGRVEGGTQITFFGEHFRFDRNFSCRFGEFVSQGTCLDSNFIACHSPNSLNTQSQFVQVQISFNQLDYSNTVEFLYENFILSDIFPLSGPMLGGTVIKLEFASDLVSPISKCIFGNVMSDMKMSSARTGYCVSPKSDVPGLTEIILSANFQDFFSVGALFEFQKSIEIHSIFPTFARKSGNSRIRIIGSNFVQGFALSCKFGSVQSTSEAFLSSTEMICLTPPYHLGSTSLQVSNNGLDYESQAYFEFVIDLQIFATIPSQGSHKGGTHITVEGSEFRDDPSLSCQIGKESTKAYLIDKKRISCITPYSLELGSFSLSVSNNGIDYSKSEISFTYFKPISIFGISPSSAANSIQTTTYISIDANQGNEKLFHLKCVFGDLSYTVNAVSLTSTLLRCVVPVHPLGISNFFLTRNDQDLEGDDVYFQFLEEMFLFAIYPNSGLSLGGDLIFAQGQGFTNTSTLECQFGAARTPATFLTEQLLMCYSPFQPPGSVTFEVLLSEAQTTNSRILFSYTQCPKGSYCPENEILPCPPGSYCPQIGSRNYTLCPAGTYQPDAGKVQCRPCSLGRFCPESGHIEDGIQCIAGYICDSHGLRIPVKPCPPGHFCLEGTLTANLTSTTTVFRPRTCPAGFYCTFGVKTPISELMNFSTPQPCYPGYYCNSGSEGPHGQGPCPSGFHCPQYSPGLIQNCPPGTFCQGVGNVSPKDCLPGTWNNLFGQSTCTPCPIGSLCPETAMTSPVVCPAGYVCDVEGMAIWSKQCPPGYYCNEGTSTYNASSDFTTRPMKCSPGTYCLSGVSSNKTVIGKLDTPQPCAEGTYCEDATSSPRGTAACPPGTYCPTGSSSPTPARRGNETLYGNSSMTCICRTLLYACWHGKC
eukprot:749635-Hanusia_phi.AAC.1